MYVKDTLGFYHFKQLSIMIFNFYMGAIVYVSALTCVHVCLNVCARTPPKQKGFRFTFVQLENSQSLANMKIVCMELLMYCTQLNSFLPKCAFY